MSEQFNSAWLQAYNERRRQRRGEVERQTAFVEPDTCDEPVGSTPLQEADVERVIVRVHSVRKRLLDEDNLCEKFLVDALRYSGFIADDRASTTKIEVSQRKCRDGETEHVLIEIL